MTFIETPKTWKRRRRVACWTNSRTNQPSHHSVLSYFGPESHITIAIVLPLRSRRLTAEQTLQAFLHAVQHARHAWPGPIRWRLIAALRGG